MSRPRNAGVALFACAALALSGCTGSLSDLASPTVATSDLTPHTPSPTQPAIPTAAPSAPSPTPTSASPERWQPQVGESWQYQLSDRLDLSVPAAVFDVDGDETSADEVAAIHALGGHAICYLSAGSWEDWRADAPAFPPAIIGSPLDDWEGENWLDIRALSALLPLISARVATCQAKGFDGVEFDNVDGYANDTGFALSSADQRTYNDALAAIAHEHGLAAGLKNDPDHVAELVGAFDFAVVEECARYGECQSYRPFIDAGKPVFAVEYGNDSSACPNEVPAGFSVIVKNLDLDARRAPCS